jgi:hypothetical protein
VPDIVVVVIVRPRGTEPAKRLGEHLIGGHLVEKGAILRLSASFCVFHCTCPLYLFIITCIQNRGGQ